MILRLRDAALLLLLSGVAPRLAAQTACVDQSYVPTPSNGLEITANQWVTQTFTVGLPGTLASIDIPLIARHRGTPQHPLEVRVVATDATGVPSGATLFQTTLQPNQVPASIGRVSIDVRAANIAVGSGQVLGIRLASQAQPGTQTYGWWGAAPGGYAAGQIWLRDTTSASAFDLAFETAVVVRAAAANYGQGHPGTLGVPALGASAPPVLGTTVDISIGASSSSPTTAALLAGFAPASQVTPFGGTLLVQVVADVTLSLPASGARVSQPIPNATALCGARVYFQAVQIDSGASHGVAFSPGLELLLGH